MGVVFGCNKGEVSHYDLGDDDYERNMEYASEKELAFYSYVMFVIIPAPNVSQLRLT
jgi:hypothetical protein